MARLMKVLVTLALLGVAQKSIAATDPLLQRAMDRGKTMYLYDRAAWVTSDDLLARLPQSRQSEIGGWIVTPSANGLHVDYFGKDSAADKVVYSVDVGDGKLANATVYPAAMEPILQGSALAMARALRAAWSEMRRHSDWQPCTNARFNTVVLTPESDGTVPVYFLTPQTETGSFPFGGHFEVDIAADGRTALTRAFTRSCITMSKPPSNGVSMPSGLVLTHLLDPRPTEIHVFEQYYVGVPVYVATGPKSLWKVEAGQIEDVSARLQQ